MAAARKLRSGTADPVPSGSHTDAEKDDRNEGACGQPRAENNGRFRYKLSSVVSDVFGMTGRAILSELAANRTNPAALAELAKGSLKSKKQDLVL